MKVRITKSVMVNGEAIREGKIIEVDGELLAELKLANCVEAVDDDVVVVIEADEKNVTDKVVEDKIVENKVEKKKQKDNK